LNRVDVFGVGFDSMTGDEAVTKAVSLMNEHRAAYIVTPNPEIVMSAWENPELMKAVNSADMVLPDGIGVVKAAKLLGTPLKSKLPGIDVATAVIEKMAQENKSVYLFGAKPGVADKAGEELKRRYASLKVCGTHNGYFKDDEPIIADINDKKPDFLLVCLGSPKQEIWMAKNAPRLDAGIMAGLGGTLDVFAGTVKRAPAVWQRLGLEWLYRCIKEPWRFKRISKLPRFLFKALGCRIRKFFNGKQG